MPRPPGPGLRAELGEPGSSAQAVAVTAREPRRAASAASLTPRSQRSATTALSAAARALYNLTTGRVVTSEGVVYGSTPERTMFWQGVSLRG